MSQTAQELGMRVLLATPYEKALQRVTDALQSEGFGVLTEIDVQATLKKKLAVDFRPYKILGACNPPLAYRALQAAPQVGLLLPCNVTVTQVDENTSEVLIVDPLAMMAFIGHEELKAVAEEARAKLDRVAAKLHHDG